MRAVNLLVALGWALAIATLVAGALAAPTLARLWRRQRIARRPFPAAWREIVRRRVPLVRELPAAQQLRLKKRIQVLLAEVPFIGCAGLTVDDEMRVTIAAQAAFLLLGRGGSFGNLREVLVYPGHFVVPRSEAGAGGVVHEGRVAQPRHAHPARRAGVRLARSPRREFRRAGDLPGRAGVGAPGAVGAAALSYQDAGSSR